MSDSQLTLERFEAEFNAQEQEALAGIVRDLVDPTLDQDQVRLRFFAMANQVLARLDSDDPGRLWGLLKGKYQPKQRDVRLVPFDELAGSLPYPLGFKLRGLLQAAQRLDEGEQEPQFAFELCAVMGVLVRLSALITIQGFVASGKKNTELNRAIVEGLRKPADGTWVAVAKRLSKALKGAEPSLAQRVGIALADKPKVDDEIKKLAKAPTTVKALDALLSFRNQLVHGDPISPEQLQQARAQLQVAIRGFAWLAEYRLEVHHAGATWSLNGSVPQPIETEVKLPEDEPYLVRRDNPEERLSLSPLLRFRSGEGDNKLDVDFDELFFLNAGTQERLSYIGYRAAAQVDGKTLGSYEAFKAFIAKIPTPPVPKNPKIDFSSFAASHSRLFVGRGPLLKELTDRVVSGEDQYVVVRALAGMGKSAVFANLMQASLNLESKTSDPIACVADGLVRAQDKWVFHFCMPTDGRNSPTVALRSLIAQICDHFELKPKDWLSQDIDELKDQKFPALLSQVGPLLSDGARLVILIDALDEGIGAEKESVPSCIPAGQYKNVVFLLSFRVDTENSNSRVKEQLKLIPEERMATVANANPLAGLTEDDAHRYLDRLVEVYGAASPTDATRAAVWAAASRNAVAGKSDGADPFYLRFFADGVQQRTIRLDRAETVPESLDDAFEDMWMGLPTDRDFLCHRVLLTLGIMREYGDDELFAALFNRERSAEDRLVPDDVAAVRTKAGKLLVYDGDRYGLFHDRFRVFLVGEQKDPIAEALGVG
jgi:hypothetical protein